VDSKETYDDILSKYKFPVFKPENGIQSRILPEIKDKASLRDNSSNLVVRKLNKDTVDNDALFDYFSKIGDVVCCKVSKTMKGDEKLVSSVSNGYGYVKFKTVE
jgi:polyadenylate-binding protein